MEANGNHDEEANSYQDVAEQLGSEVGKFKLYTQSFNKNSKGSTVVMIVGFFLLVEMYFC